MRIITQEKKYHNSLANQVYAFPRDFEELMQNNDAGNESSSLSSLKEALSYDLHAQNNKGKIKNQSSIQLITTDKNSNKDSPSRVLKTEIAHDQCSSPDSDKKPSEVPESGPANEVFMHAENQAGRRLKTEGNEPPAHKKKCNHN